MLSGAGNKDSVSYLDLVNELQKEKEYQKNGGTSYRLRTVEISLDVVYKVKNIRPFYKRTITKQLVSQLKPDLDLERINDVAKMLNVIAKDLSMNATLPEETRAYVEGKRKNRKQINLMKDQED